MGSPLFATFDSGGCRLIASRCVDCRRVEFPRRTSYCAACEGAYEDIELAGPALLRSKTSVEVQPPDAKISAPYQIGVAQFLEGICVLGLLQGAVDVGTAIVPTVMALPGAADTFAFVAAPDRGAWADTEPAGTQFAGS